MTGKRCAMARVRRLPPEPGNSRTTADRELRARRTIGGFRVFLLDPFDERRWADAPSRRFAGCPAMPPAPLRQRAGPRHKTVLI